MAFAFFLGGPSGCVCFASCSSAGAPAEGAAMAGWQPLSVRERGRCGAAATGHRVAALSQCSPSCAVQGRTLKKSCVFIVSSYGYRPSLSSGAHLATWVFTLFFTVSAAAAAAEQCVKYSSRCLFESQTLQHESVRFADLLITPLCCKCG